MNNFHKLKFINKRIVIFLFINFTFFFQPFISSYGTYPLSDILIMSSIYFLNNLFYSVILRQIRNLYFHFVIASVFIILNLYFYFFVLAYFSYLYKLLLILFFIFAYLVLIFFNRKRYSLIFFLFFIFISIFDSFGFQNFKSFSWNQKFVGKEKKREKHNVYIIGIDGLVSKKFFYKFYDTSFKIYKTLNLNNFETRDVFSPGSSTLQTYASLVSYHKIENPNQYNNVFSNKYSEFYLESSRFGYRKQFVFDVDYFGIDQNNIFDYYYPKSISFCNFCFYVNPRWGMGVCSFLNSNFLSFGNSAQKKITSREDFYKSHNNHIFLDSSKWFSIQHIWLPGHSSQYYNSNNYLDYEKFKNTYLEDIDKANFLIEKIIKFIIQNDKSPIIVFLGDHGSWLLRNFTLGNKIESLTVTEEDLFNDKYGTLLSIYPKKVGIELFKKIDHDPDISLLFKYLLDSEY